MSPTKKTRKVNKQTCRRFTTHHIALVLALVIQARNGNKQIRRRVTTHHIALVLAPAIQARDGQIPGLCREVIGQSPLLLLPLLLLLLLFRPLLLLRPLFLLVCYSR